MLLGSINVTDARYKKRSSKVEMSAFGERIFFGYALKLSRAMRESKKMGAGGL